MPKRHPRTASSPLPPARAWFLTFAIAVAAAFSPAIRGPFLYDDFPAIVENQSIRELFSPAVVTAMPAQSPVSGRPVVNASLALNYAINEALDVDQRPDPLGPNKTVGYRALNLAIHVGCGLLLFGIIRRTLRVREGMSGDANAIAGASTLLWLLHPIQTEAVHYIIQRSELMVSAFYAATLYASIRAWDATDDRARRRWYAAGLALCALGMLSKEVMITAPLMIVLYDRAFRATAWNELRENAPRLRFYGGLAATMLIVVWSIAVGSRNQSVGFDFPVTWYQYLITQAWAVARYVRLIVLPTGLTFDYGMKPITDVRVVPGLIFLSAAAVASIWAWTRQRWLWLAFFGAWFFLILAPSSSVVPIVTEIAAERRIYLASAPLFVLVVLGIGVLVLRARHGVGTARAIAIALAAILGTATFVRGRTYADAERLFRDNIAKAPANPRADVHLGMHLARRGPTRIREAIASMRSAAEKDSTYYVAWRSLGFLEASQGQWTDATSAYEQALRLRPNSVDANVLMARALIAQGRTGDAIPHIEKIGLADAPLLWSAGQWLVEHGNGSAAIKFLEGAANTSREAPPVVGVALISLAYAQSGRKDDALLAAREAASRAADTVDAYVIAGHAMLKIGRREEAMRYAQRALTIDPNSESAKRALAAAGR